MLAWGHASAWFSPFWRGPAPGGQSTQANASLAGPGTKDAVTQLKVALGALEEALVLLANHEGNHRVAKRESCEEQTDRKALTAIDRARIFQRWEASRRQEKHGRQQSQRFVKRKFEE